LISRHKLNLAVRCFPFRQIAHQDSKLHFIALSQ
jgi:hypothetical protein